MLDQSPYTSPLSECEKSPMGCMWTLGPQLVELFGEVVDLQEVESCWRKWVTGRWALRDHSLFYFPSALCFLTTDASHRPPCVPCYEGLPNLNSRADQSLPPLNSVFSSHSNKKSEHYNHLRVHVLAHECWKTIKHSNHSTAVPIQSTEKQKWFKRPAQCCQPSWYNWYLISTMPNHSRIYSTQAEWNRPC